MKEDKTFYKRLHSQLAESNSWPGTYIFKFIIPTSNNSKDLLIDLFESENVKVSVRTSSKGKYTSISISGIFANPSIIIEKHKLAAKIPNIIQL
jgi:hypothetical protein